MPRFSVSVTDEQDAWVERQAAERDRSKSEIIRHLIDAQRRAGEDDTGVVNTADSPAVHGDAPADQAATGGPSTRALAAQLERVTERLDELEATVTDTAAGTPSEATDRAAAGARPDSEPAQGDGSTATAARSVPSPNEDGIIEAESRTPEPREADDAVDGSADAASGGTEATSSAQPSTASGSSADADTDAASEPAGDTGGTWPSGDSHPDPDALAETAYSGGQDATGGRDTGAGGQAPGTQPGSADAGAADAADSTVDQQTPADTTEPPGGDQAADDGDLVYAAQTDATDAGNVADDDADADDGADDTAAAADAATTDEDTDATQAAVDEDAAEQSAESEGPFAGMTGDVDPEDLEAKLETVIDEPALAESVFRCWEQLRDRGTAHRRIFKSHYEDTGDGYDSPDAWWRAVSDHFEALPGVEAPAGGGNFYRYRYNR